jgi:hypothetical protein
VRESRMRRAMWRELETWPGWNGEPTAPIESVRVATLHLQQARQFSTLPGGLATIRETALSSLLVSDTIPSTVWVFDRVLRFRRPTWGDTVAST